MTSAANKTPPNAPIWTQISRYCNQMLIAAVSFQLLVLISMVAGSYRTIVRGETVMLKVIPVDPRDLFRGDYVILSYDFSTELPPNISPDDPTIIGRDIYIPLVLAEDGKHHHSAGARWTKPEFGLFLKGRINSGRRHEFGIGQFFVQEGQGRVYEDAVLRRQLSAEVTIDPSGNGVLRKLIVNN
jgi:uncharacterized membrane-anchored protein